MIPALFSFVLGIFSMGFQLLGSRLLNPWFGSSIVVWAFIISTFLAAFSIGSVAGGLIARFPAERRRTGMRVLLALAIGGFLLNAVAARGLLGWIDDRLWPMPAALALSCGLLFLPPICGLAGLTPLLIQRLSEDGQAAGFASGLIYCIGTLGNICGIMLTVFLFIPHLPVSVLLWVWTAGAAVSAAFLAPYLKR